ncbi:MAG: F0F1 ATP synthase subunit A [Myxococcota bacterium]
MNVSPDTMSILNVGHVTLNATLVFTWLIMFLLTVGAWLATRNLTRSAREVTRWQSFLEILVRGIQNQIEQISHQNAGPFLPFVGTLFIFIATANVLSIVPGYVPPTSSLSTTTALAIGVFIAVPAYGVWKRGLLGYLKVYLQPTWFMLPFNVIGELSRTLALAVRLYGNVMSGTIIAAILLTLVPFIFPVVMQLLGLLTGMIQAYIFAVLATVYIASAAAPPPSSERNTNGIKE